MANAFVNGITVAYDDLGEGTNTVLLVHGHPFNRSMWLPQISVRGRAERPSYEDTLARLAIPALVVVGSEDAFTTRQHAEQMRDLLKNSELVWIEGVGHMPNLESTAAFNAALVQFLERVGSSMSIVS